VDRKLIFRDEADAEHYLRALGRTARRRAWRCLAYCLMGNHLHLLIETTQPNLGLGMQHLHGPYAMRFNKRHGRTGPLFEGRFDAKPMLTDAQLLQTAAYIARNPSKAGLCARPGDWALSSYRGVLDGTAPGWLDVDRLLWFFGANGGEALERYRKFVEGDRG
jgi:REP element-mobilizing transposase RayT